MLAINLRPFNSTARLGWILTGVLLASNVVSARESIVASAALDPSSRSPVVEVHVNGQGPFRFLVDTGAEDAIAIDRGLAERLELSTAAHGEEESDSADVRYRIERLTFGGGTFTHLESAGFDASELNPGDDGPVGVLGLPLFADHLLILDFAAGELRVEVGALGAPDGEDILPYENGEAPTIEIQVAGRTMTSEVSTGRFGGVGLPLKLKDELPLATEAGLIGRIRTPEGLFGLWGSSLDGEVRIGGQRLENPRVLFHDSSPVANIGPAALDDFAVTFDAANRRVRFQRVESRTTQALHQRAAQVASLSEGAPDLREAFNRDRADVRLILILSPT